MGKPRLTSFRPLTSVSGYGVGIVSDLAPLYQAEIAHPSIRGRLTTLQQFMLGIGGKLTLMTSNPQLHLNLNYFCQHFVHPGL